MVLFGITLFCAVLFIWLLHKDKRQLVNGFVLLLTLAFSFFSMIHFAYTSNLVNLHQILLGVLYGFVPFLIVLTGVCLIINGIYILKKESKSLSNSLSLVMGSGIVLYSLLTMMYIRYSYDVWSQNGTIGRLAIYSYHTLTFIVILCIFVLLSFLAYSLLYLALPKDKNYDYIIVHGSGLIDGYKVPPLLAARIDKAIEAYNAATKKTVKFIASGGQGHDEKISEARAIADYLLNKGIEEECILVEDTSTTTYENLKYSKELALLEMENPQFLFVTNNYHVLRTSFYAKRLQLKGEGLGAKTASYYIPSAFIREYIAILSKLKWYLVTLFILFVSFLTLTL